MVFRIPKCIHSIQWPPTSPAWPSLRALGRMVEWSGMVRVALDAAPARAEGAARSARRRCATGSFVPRVVVLVAAACCWPLWSLLSLPPLDGRLSGGRGWTGGAYSRGGNVTLVALNPRTLWTVDPFEPPGRVEQWPPAGRRFLRLVLPISVVSCEPPSAGRAVNRFEGWDRLCVYW